LADALVGVCVDAAVWVAFKKDKLQLLKINAKVTKIAKQNNEERFTSPPILQTINQKNHEPMDRIFPPKRAKGKTNSIIQIKKIIYIAYLLKRNNQIRLNVFWK
jgi:hypothetical protein